MSQTHWKKLGDPNFLGGYDFEDGERKTLTIKSIENMEAFNPGDKKTETVRACKFVEKVKPMILNSTNAKMLEKLYKSSYIEDWRGRKFVVHFDKTVKVGGKLVGGLRIMDMLPGLPQNEIPKCFDCGKAIESAGKMNEMQVVAYTQKKYGKPLCADCATRINLAEKAQDALQDVLSGEQNSEEIQENIEENAEENTEKDIEENSDENN